MKILVSIWEGIWALVSFLVTWIFLPVFTLIGLYLKWKGKLPTPKYKGVAGMDANFLEKIEFKLDEEEVELMKAIIERLRERGYGQY